MSAGKHILLFISLIIYLWNEFQIGNVILCEKDEKGDTFFHGSLQGLEVGNGTEWSAFSARTAFKMSRSSRSICTPLNMVRPLMTTEKNLPEIFVALD